MNEIKVEAEPREAGSSNAARRLRAEHKLPAVLYGGDADSIPISVDPKDIIDILRSDSGQNTLFEVTVGDGSPETVMIFDIQVDPVTHHLQHADLVRIAMDRTIQVEVPVELVGTPAGVKEEGGVLDHSLREVLVECLPGDIPDELTVDVSHLTIGDSVSIEDLEVPVSVKVMADPNRNVASVVAPISEEELEAAVESLATELEPELVGEEEELLEVEEIPEEEREEIEEEAEEEEEREEGAEE